MSPPNPDVFPAWNTFDQEEKAMFARPELRSPTPAYSSFVRSQHPAGNLIALPSKNESLFVEHAHPPRPRQRRHAERWSRTARSTEKSLFLQCVRPVKQNAKPCQTGRSEQRITHTRWVWAQMRPHSALFPPVGRRSPPVGCPTSDLVHRPIGRRAQESRTRSLPSSCSEFDLGQPSPSNALER